MQHNLWIDLKQKGFDNEPAQIVPAPESSNGQAPAAVEELSRKRKEESNINKPSMASRVHAGYIGKERTRHKWLNLWDSQRMKINWMRQYCLNFMMAFKGRCQLEANLDIGVLTLLQIIKTLVDLSNAVYRCGAQKYAAMWERLRRDPSIHFHSHGQLRLSILWREI